MPQDKTKGRKLRKRRAAEVSRERKAYIDALKRVQEKSNITRFGAESGGDGVEVGNIQPLHYAEVGPNIGPQGGSDVPPKFDKNKQPLKHAMFSGDFSEIDKYTSQGYSHHTADYLIKRREKNMEMDRTTAINKMTVIPQIKKSAYRNIPKSKKFKEMVGGFQPGLTPLEKQNMRQEEANHVAETRATAKKTGVAWYKAGIIAITEDLGLKFNPFDMEE